MAASELFDIHAELWKRGIDSALPYKEFVSTGSDVHRNRWNEWHERVSLSAEQGALLKSFTRTMHVLVLAGMWCGDCARQCPILARIAESCPSMNLQFLDNQSDIELRDELRVHGAARVPAVVVLSEDGFEVARGMDRTLSTYRRKARTELGAACELGAVPPPHDELAADVTEWVAFFERAQLLLRVSPFLRNRHRD
jgi:thiol-disulfide isomerase/thioredoxin